MVKKPLFFNIFLVFLFLVCSNCSKNLINCDIFPNFKEIDYKDSETRKKIGKEIIIYAGEVIKYRSISHINDRSELTNYLKGNTYNLKNE